LRTFVEYWLGRATLILACAKHNLFAVSDHFGEESREVDGEKGDSVVSFV
jgi:hypothetical protein